MRKLRSALVYLPVPVFLHRRFTNRNFFILGLVMLFLVVGSQEHRTIVRLGVDDGLSQGSVFDLVQDDKGFIWMATADGLNRYDGHGFDVYNTSSSDTFSFAFTRLRNILHTKDAIWTASSQTLIITRIDLLTGEVKQIFDFAEESGYGDACPVFLSGDTLWTIVSNQGLFAVSVSAGKIIHEFPEPANAFPANSVCWFDTSSRTLWYIGTAYTELCSFSIDRQTYTHRSFLTDSGDSLGTYCLSHGEDGLLRIGSQECIIVYDPVSGERKINVLPPVSGAPRILTAAYTANNGTWCGTNDGYVYLLDELSGKFSLQCHPTETAQGVGHRIVSMMMDRSENLWVGTDPAGVMRIDTKQKPFNHTCFQNNNTTGLRSNFMKCFREIGNEMFIGTYDQGINVLNRKDGTYRYISGPGDNQPVIYNITSDSLGRIWAYTATGIAVAERGSSQLIVPQLTGHTFLLSSRIGTTIYAQRNGTILVGTRKGLFYMKPTGTTYAVDSTTLHANVECFFTDRNGNLWMGSSEGIYRSEGSSPHDLKMIVSGTGLVKCIWQSKDGVMWAGTDHGLCKVNERNDGIARFYSEKDGMPNAFVYGVIGDDAGKLWLSTNKGLSRFDPETETFRNYSVTDGLQSNEFNTNAHYKTVDGELYFGGINGYNHFYPEAIQDNPYVPQSVITAFKIFDKEFPTDSAIGYKRHITVDYLNNNLLLEYTGLEFSDAERNNFRYRLLGLDTNWVEARDARFARFVNLDPGDYTFQLKAANNDGVWNNIPTELRITITPPFWQTTWFIVSAVVIGLLLIMITTRFYFRRQVHTQTREFSLKQSARMNAIIETEERERKRIAEELHDGLGQLLSTARLNISGVETTLPEKDAQLWKNSLTLLDEACSEVRSISHNMMPGALIRSGLIEAVNDLANKISDSGKIQVEFNTELEQRFPETVEIAVYRIVQEILNNMIKHSGADKITIDMNIVGDHLRLHIADNGRSFDVKTIRSSEGIGWKNIYSRVEILNGEIDVKSEKGTGTSVFLSVSFR